MKSNKKRILAVASGGGHWVQLLRLRPAFDEHDLAFLTTNEGYKTEVEGKVFIVTDANMWEKLRLLRMFIEVAWILIKFRPNIIVTTGAAPGFAAIMFGRMLGLKTIWMADTMGAFGKA
jgi:UDP-N-acetylglucosamine:LPS N-acetylglucosamine transferase